uniref:Temporin-1Tl n=1 Tax=Rana temporaria TaxID=8407 RepID=TPL_RANTE|nr:RecName: Full=Temporin-1Tl; Short=TL; AltName: Full=Temporin-L [Rana temporaria]6GS5_A Chain A, Temporin-L [Rana temporaria]8TV4_A Chain A, Temporin-1Tl peptide [Rana temporaria]
FVQWFSKFLGRIL